MYRAIQKGETGKSIRCAHFMMGRSGLYRPGSVNCLPKPATECKLHHNGKPRMTRDRLRRGVQAQCPGNRWRPRESALPMPAGVPGDGIAGGLPGGPGGAAADLSEKAGSAASVTMIVTELQNAPSGEDPREPAAGDGFATGGHAFRYSFGAKSP